MTNEFKQKKKKKTLKITYNIMASILHNTFVGFNALVVLHVFNILFIF